MSIVVQWEIIKWVNGLTSLTCIFVILITWFNVFVLEFEFTTKRIGYYSGFGILFFTISSIANTTLRIISGYDDNESAITHWLPSLIYSSTWCLGQIFVYLLFMERLRFSFKGTKYQTSPKYYCLFYIGIALFFISSFTFQATRILHQTNIINSYLLLHSGEVRDLTQQIIHFLLSIGLLYVFNKKLWILSMDLSHFANPSINAYDVTLNVRQESIIRIAARLTVISSFAIISTQFLMIYTTIIYEVCAYTECGESKYLYYLPIADFIWCLDCLINIICIFLSFDFMASENAYYHICNWCDFKCIACCGNIAQKSLGGNKNDYIPMPLTTPSNIQSKTESNTNGLIQQFLYEVTDPVSCSNRELEL